MGLQSPFVNKKKTGLSEFDPCFFCGLFTKKQELSLQTPCTAQTLNVRTPKWKRFLRRFRSDTKQVHSSSGDDETKPTRSENRAGFRELLPNCDALLVSPRMDDDDDDKSSNGVRDIRGDSVPLWQRRSVAPPLELKVKKSSLIKGREQQVMIRRTPRKSCHI
ncbi:hypothetical protein O6H91_21G016400 [Diphasiastrum complanatum]|uniref:Uncharacterized protein n=1 Tax=Diphasiastrum complanatum TaxID=34168 RepID=A0ACC2AIB6_DIPCM|nr:hypothetical protein O6H91_21G016400 [Diphasiastrum complanatum]